VADLSDPGILVQQERLLDLAARAEVAAEELHGVVAKESGVAQADYLRGMLQLNVASMRRYARALDDDDDPEEVADLITRQELEFNRTVAQTTEANEFHSEAKLALEKAKRSNRRSNILLGLAMLVIFTNLGFQIGRIVGGGL